MAVTTDQESVLYVRAFYVYGPRNQTTSCQ